MMRLGIASFLAAITITCLGALTAAAKDVDRVLDAFVADVNKSPEATAQQRALVAELVRQLRQSPEGQTAVITESLRVLHPEFNAALAALGEDNLGAAIIALTKLRDSADAWLAADSSFYLARAYLLDEHFEAALPLLADLQEKWAAKTASGGEVLFLRGVAEAALLKHQEAKASLKQFLASYPEAPERMRVGAFRQLEQLKQYQEGTLSDVHLRMDFSRRKLALEDTGHETRTQQDKIIDILAKLIKESEERECNCRGGGGGGQGKKQGQTGESQSQNQGEGNQAGSTGGGSKGTDTDALQRLHRGGPQSPWSRLRDKDRDPVYSAIKDKFPARYQQLVEQYYKSFQDDSP